MWNMQLEWWREILNPMALVEVTQISTVWRTTPVKATVPPDKRPKRYMQHIPEENNENVDHAIN